MLRHRYAQRIATGLAAVLCTAALVWSGAEASSASAATPCVAEAMDQHKAVAAAAVEAIWNGKDTVEIDTLVAGDFRYQEAGKTPMVIGARGVAFLTRLRRSSFPDLTYAIDEIVAEGDRVAVRWTATGTQQGAYGLTPPTGAQVAWSGVSFFTVADGRINAAWVNEDWQGVDRQLGIDGQPTWGPAYYR